MGRGAEILISLAMLVLLVLVVLALVLLRTKLVPAQWFGEDGGIIRPKSITQELIVKTDTTSLQPRAAFNYIVFPSTNTTAPSSTSNLTLNTKFFTRGMVITFINESDSKKMVSIENIIMEIDAGDSVMYIVQSDNKLRLVTAGGSCECAPPEE